MVGQNLAHEIFDQLKENGTEVYYKSIADGKHNLLGFEILFEHFMIKLLYKP